MDFFQLSAGALAYLGDSVLEALIREALILKGFEKSAHLNKEALKYVTAVNQCKAYGNRRASGSLQGPVWRSGSLCKAS